MGESIVIDAIYNGALSVLHAGYEFAEALGAIAVGPLNIAQILDASAAVAAFGVAIYGGKMFVSWLKSKVFNR